MRALSVDLICVCRICMVSRGDAEKLGTWNDYDPTHLRYTLMHEWNLKENARVKKYCVWVWYMIARNIWVSTTRKGKHNLTTKARRAVVGRNKQLDEGAGRQIWKCHDPLNCVTPVAFWKHGTWVQLWHLGANMDWHFWGTSADSAVVRLASASGLIAMAVITQVRMVSKPANPETCCTICDQYRIAGVVVCKNFRANTWHVGAVSYTTCSQMPIWVVFWGYAGQPGIVRGMYSLKSRTFSLVNWFARYAGTGHGW